MALADVKVIEKTKTKVKKPSKYAVKFFNDDKTSMEFVIQVLMTIFNHSPESATQLMLKIHQNGSGVAGVYSHEIAEQKAFETTQAARIAGYPLQVKVEED